MGLHRFRRLTGFAIAGLLAALHAVAIAQSAPARAMPEQLKRVGTDLFSAAPHPAEAIRELKAILAAEPGLAEGHMLLGIAYRAQGSTDLMGEAVAELRQALALAPSLVLARLALARVYLDMARATRAREELQVALEQVPGNPQILSLLGETERQLGSPRRSLELNQQALQADATLLQARYYLGLAFLDLRQPADAVREMQLVVKAGANAAEANLGLGTAYLDAGRVTEALAALRESARLDPARPDTHIQLSRAYRSKGLLNEAVKALALAKLSGAATVSALYHNVESDLYMEEGLVRLQQGRLEAAAEAFRKVLQVDSNHAPATERLAEVRKRLQERARRKQPGAPS